MKILYVVHQFFPLFHTGTERLTLDIAKQIQRMGHFVTVLTYEPIPPIDQLDEKSSQNFVNSDDFISIDEQVKKKEYQVQTIPVISFKHSKFRMGFQIFDKVLEPYLYDLVKQFDLVHFTHPMRFSSIVKACKEIGKPTVLTLTDNWLLSPRSLLTSDYQLCDGPNEGKKCMELCHYGEEVLTRYQEAKLFFDNIDYVVAGSEFLRQTFWNNNWKRKIELNPFSVDYSNVKIDGEPSELVFGFIGSLIWHKGPHVLIEAFKQVKNKKIKLKIYGKGDERDPYLKDLKDSAKNDSRIEFCGTFDYADLPKVMKEISVLVIPSTYKDNFPLVMQTSLAYKKPVIGSKIGGIPEVVKDGINGHLFEPGNVEQLARIIFSLSENNKIQELKDGIIFPPRIEEEALRYENLYRQLLSLSEKKDSSNLFIEQKIPKTKNYEKNKANLLLVSHNLNYEGAPLWLFYLAKELKTLGYEITVVSPFDGPLKNYYLNEKIKLLVEPNFKDKENIDVNFFQNFDLIVLNTILNSIFVEPLNELGKPSILSIHESEREFYMSPINRESHLKHATKVTFVANATKKIYSDLEKNNNFKTIHNCLDTSKIKLFKSQNNRDDLRKK